LPFCFLEGACHGAGFGIDKAISKIDCLIYYNNFETAERKVDSLYGILKNRSGKKQVQQALEVRYQKALIADNRFDHGKALPVFMEVLDGAAVISFIT